MEKTNPLYHTYVSILNRELVKAMGCTEPIAIAYCAAKARDVLGALPESMTVAASGNIIKNVKSVVVPNSNGQKGIPVAAALGALGGDPQAELLVIANVSDEVKNELSSYMEESPIEVTLLDSDALLEVEVTAYSKGDSARVHIINEHTNVIEIEKNGQILYKKDAEEKSGTCEDEPDYTLLTVKDIYDFATTCDLADVEELLHLQISCNKAIAEEGLANDYGANIGSTLLKSCGNDVRTRAKAMAAAGSDARMSGCEMPVVINSGSGNQGMTASLPVIVFAEEKGVSHEVLLRALLISNLITIHAKTSIGRLSAYCGAITAGAGAGAGIAYVCGGDVDVISHTIVNALAVTSGVVCDGAKPSCAAKIAIAVEAGILGYDMYRNGQQFYGGDGLVLKGVENSITNFGHLASVAMSETNKEICRMMASC